ncbi:MAG: MmcQ/YjbR family DNA-binding protein [Bacteroidetes bacterium]|nr:MmcQ/YjbR family DNA-binding protein [Bacteroidota bacterium]MCW5894566.1 MmcQ/YjbR family DNA-binding protein [Bacteroidota bacterium]
MNIETIRAICTELPGVTEDIKWGDNLCFLAGGKIFCIANLSGSHSASFKVTEEEFEEMADRPGLCPAPYLAKNKWIMAERPDAMTRTEWDRYLTQSYNLITSKLPAKTRAALSRKKNAKSKTSRKRVAASARRRARTT